MRRISYYNYYYQNNYIQINNYSINYDLLVMLMDRIADLEAVALVVVGTIVLVMLVNALLLALHRK